MEWLPAVQRPLELQVDESVGEWQMLRLSIRDGSERLCWQLTRPYSEGMHDPFTRRLALPVGPFTFEAQFDDRDPVRRSFEIREADSQQEALRFELR